MTLEDVKVALQNAGFSIAKEKRLTNNTGTQLSLENGALVNVFDRGTLNVQGKNTEEVKIALGKPSSQRQPSANEKVFVVYGHNKQARDQLEAMLRRWHLEPLILDQLPSEGQTIIEKLESYTAKVNFGVVLATPDDQGHRADHPDEKAHRARQNVVLELGMLLAHLGRQRVAILLKEQEKMERPSDIQGLIYIPFKDDLAKDAGLILAKEMTSQGYQIDVKSL